MIEKNRPYMPGDRLRDLIRDNSLLLMVISRFGLTLRQTSHTLADIEKDCGFHAATLLCVANMISGRPYDPASVDLRTLMDYLKRAHTYFLEFFLPDIRRKLVSGTDYSRSGEMMLTILRFYDEYVAEVRRHMDYENDTLFGYVENLLEGAPVDENYNIALFAEHHDAIADKLNRLKDVLIAYCPEGDANIINSVLFDIINCEADLISHCDVENRILVPAVAAAEKNAVSIRKKSSGDKTAHHDAPQALGRREEEIIVCVAKGLSNKEIADRLCISVNTVTTHRRNICAKLDIHSPAGLTIYAILNGLVDPKEIDL